MSSVQMVSATAAASRPIATRAGAAYRDAASSVGASPDPAERAEAANRGDIAVRSVTLAQQTIKAAHDQAHYAEWVERVRSAPRATSLLVQRPSPDAYRLGYPTAMEAYREVTRLVEKL